MQAHQKISREDAEVVRLDIRFWLNLLAQTNPWAAIGLGGGKECVHQFL